MIVHGVSVLLPLQYYIFTEIIQPPTDKIVFPTQSATFICEATGDFHDWHVNGIAYNNLPADVRTDIKSTPQDIDNRGQILTLTIPAKIQYNGTNVKCITGNLNSPLVESNTVTMKIQGIDLYAHNNIFNIHKTYFLKDCFHQLEIWKF